MRGFGHRSYEGNQLNVSSSHGGETSRWDGPRQVHGSEPTQQGTPSRQSEDSAREDSATEKTSRHGLANKTSVQRIQASRCAQDQPRL